MTSYLYDVKRNSNVVNYVSQVKEGYEKITKNFHAKTNETYIRKKSHVHKLKFSCATLNEELTNHGLILNHRPIITSNSMCFWFKGNTALKHFSITDFFSKCDQICRILWIWSHLLKKSLMGNFIFLRSETFIKCIKKVLDREKLFNITPVYDHSWTALYHEISNCNN